MKTLILTLALLLFAASAQAATYYVDGSLGGNCAGGAGTSYSVAARDCSASDGTKAWTTPQGPVSSLAPGDTVYVRTGTYTGAVGGKVLSITGVSGTSGNPITYAKYASEVVNLVCGSSWDSSWAVGGANEDLGPYPEFGVYLWGVNYITIDGFLIGGTLGATGAYNNASCYYGIAAYGNNIRILNNEIKYTWNHGLTADGSSNLELAYNKIHDTVQLNFPRGGANLRNTTWGAGASAQGGGTGFNAHDNFFYFNHGEGLSTGGGASGSTFLRNVFSDCWGACIYTDGASNTVWDSNFFYFTETGKHDSGGNFNNTYVAALSMSVEEAYASTNLSNISIRNNVAVNTKYLVEGFTGPGYPHNNIWTNFSIIGNTMVGSQAAEGSGCIQLDNTTSDGGGSITNLTIKNNICAHMGGTYGRQIYSESTANSGWAVTNNIFDISGGNSTTFCVGATPTCGDITVIPGQSGNIATTPGLVDEASISGLNRLWDDVTLGAGESLAGVTAAAFIAAKVANYKLAAGSDALEAGFAAGAPYNLDILSVSRPQVTLWDIGALEKITGAATWELVVGSTDPTSGVTITVSPNSLDGDCTGATPIVTTSCTFNDGELVTLTAPATSGGQIFTSWTGTCNLGTNPLICTLTMASDRTVTANYTDPPVGDVMAWWKMDEGSGTSAADSSGNSNTGTLTGAGGLPTWTTHRGVTAVHFDGVDDSINIAASATLSFNVTNAWSIAVSVLPDSAPTGWQNIIAANVSGNYIWALSASDGGNCGNGSTSAGFVHSGLWTVVCDPNPLSAIVATRLVWTYDGATSRLYKNGVLVASAASGAVIDDSSASAVQIGQDAASEPFLGKLWNLKVWNIALTAAQIIVDAPSRLVVGGAIAMGGKIAGN